MQLPGHPISVITGAASGFGLEFARVAAQRGHRIVMVDVQAPALSAAADAIRTLGATVIDRVVNVADAAAVEALAAEVEAAWGAPHLVFNNAGVAHGGLIWEHSLPDWEWVLGVNVMGVVHGLRSFMPRMLAAAAADPDYRGCMVNTASMAGLVNAPNMGAYNVSKHAVVSLTETLYQDLSLVTDQVRAAVLCPYFVSTGISHSHRNRPASLAEVGGPTPSQRIAQAMSEKAVGSGKVTAVEVAQRTFHAIDNDQFYILSHPQALAPVQTRMEDVLQQRNPTDPFAARPEVGARLRAALRGEA